MVKVAVAYDNGEIGEHFGHAECFAFYEYNESVYDCKKTLQETKGLHGHADMAKLMADNGISAVICQSMGDAAVQLLLENGIYPVLGYCGDADTAADMLVTGQLQVGGGCGGNCGGGCGGGCGGDSDEGCGCGGGCGCH